MLFRSTTDGGLTWNVINDTDIPRLLNSSAFTYIKSFDSGVVYVYGVKNSNGEPTIWKSLDSGVTFTEQGVDTELGIVKALNDTTLYTTTSVNGGVLKVSVDSGATFSLTTMPASNGAHFISATEGYTTTNGDVYFSDDLGATSSIVTSPVLPAGTWYSTELHMVDEVSGCTDSFAYNYNSLATDEDGSCLFAAKLTDTANPANVIVADDSISDPFLYLGKTVKLVGDDYTCYTVSYSPTNVGVVGVDINLDFIDAATCELSFPIPGPYDVNAYNHDTNATVSDGSELYAYRLTDTRGVEGWKITNTDDFSLYVGLAVKVTEYPDICWTVTYETDLTNDILEVLTHSDDYVDGATCELTLPTGYLLTDVAGNAPTIVTATDLSANVGQVVKVNGARICYLVALHPNMIGAIPVNVYSSFADGATCLLTLEVTNDFECADDEEEEVIEVVEAASVPHPIKLNSYYQSKYRLDQIVREFIIERGEQTEHNYARFLQLSINGLRELNMDISGSAKMVVLEIKDDMTVDLPSDFINYVKIGVCGSNGEIMSLGHNPNLCKARYADDCGNITHKQGTVANNGIPVYIDNINSHYRNGEVVGRFFGEGGGYNSNGEYVLDKERGVLQLSSVMATEIVLEYVADISKMDGSFTIHPYIIETVKAYIAWSSIRRKLGVPLQEKELARRDYYNERRLAGLRFSSFTMDEAKATIRKAFKLAPKM